MSTATDELINAYLAELEREAARLPWNARTELLEDVRSHIEVALAEMRETSSGGAELGDASALDGADAGSGSGSGGPDLSGAPSGTDEIAQVRAMLSALGEPAEIVAAALADEPSLATSPEPAYPTRDLSAAGAPPYRTPTRQSPPHPLGTADIGAVTLLLLGGFLAGVGWLVGVVLLWTSPRWTRLEKLIGTLIIPGGIAGGLMVLITPVQSGSTFRCVNGQCGNVPTGWHPPAWLAISLALIIVLAPVATAVFLVNRAHSRPGFAPASRAAVAIIAGVGTLGLLGVVGLLFATSTSSAGGHATPVPENSGAPVSGYAVPISSPTVQYSSASAP